MTSANLLEKAKEAAAFAAVDEYVKVGFSFLDSFLF